MHGVLVKFFTYEWVLSHMHESRHLWMSHVTYEWVMSLMNESCRICMSHVTYEWVMSHIDESCHIWMSHVTHAWVMSPMNESYHVWISHVTYERVMSRMARKWNKWVMPRTTWQSNTSRINYSNMKWMIYEMIDTLSYGVATTCRLLKIIGLFCKRALYKRRYSAKETSQYTVWGGYDL